jgi:hypothetical protein
MTYCRLAGDKCTAAVPFLSISANTWTTHLFLKYAYISLIITTLKIEIQMTYKCQAFLAFLEPLLIHGPFKYLCIMSLFGEGQKMYIHEQSKY